MENISKFAMVDSHGYGGFVQKFLNRDHEHGIRIHGLEKLKGLAVNPENFRGLGKLFTQHLGLML